MSDPDLDTGGNDAETREERADDDGNRGLSDRAAFWTSALIALALAVGSVWLIGVRAVHFEALNRVRPTVDGGGVGTGWIEGNTAAALDWLITLVHFADVVMGVFILAMVFIHWIAFRRLAARMRPPDAPRRTDDAVATDGGEARPTGAPRDREHGAIRSEARTAGSEREETTREWAGPVSERRNRRGGDSR